MSAPETASWGSVVNLKSAARPSAFSCARICAPGSKPFGPASEILMPKRLAPRIHEFAMLKHVSPRKAILRPLSEATRSPPRPAAALRGGERGGLGGGGVQEVRRPVPPGAAPPRREPLHLGLLEGADDD